MRIQWSSDAARAMLSKLEQSDQGLEGCLRQAVQILAALDEANADGDDSALAKAKERFEISRGRLLALIRALEDFIEALRRAEELFEQAEEDTIHLTDGRCDPYPVVRPQRERYPVLWAEEAFTVMPEMRTRITALPDWLEDLTAAEDAILV